MPAGNDVRLTNGAGQQHCVEELTVDVLPDLHLLHAQRRADERRGQVAAAPPQRCDRACSKKFRVFKSCWGAARQRSWRAPLYEQKHDCGGMCSDSSDGLPMRPPFRNAALQTSMQMPGLSPTIGGNPSLAFPSCASKLA